MKKETQLRVVKFLSTYHFRFFQIMLSLLAMKGILIPDINGSKMAAIMLLVGSVIGTIVFQFLIKSKHERVEVDF